MTKFKSTDHDLTIAQLEDAALETVLGGANIEQYLSPQLRLAYHPVGGWTMQDVFAVPTLGTYH